MARQALPTHTIGPKVTFAHRTPASKKVTCQVCGRTGWGPTDPDPGINLFTDDPRTPAPWQLACLRGHLPCPRCGRLIVVNNDGRPRTHSRCPKGADA